jgi:uncharacterized protein with gpF-like domain
VSSLSFNAKPVPQIIAVKQGERRRKGRKGPLRFRRIPRQRLPMKIERQLRSRIFRSLAQARELIEARLIPRLPELERMAVLTTRDSGLVVFRSDVEPWPDIVARILDDIRAQFAQGDSVLDEAARIAADQTSNVNRSEVSRQLRTVLGVDIFVAEPRLGETLASSVRENVGLIKSVPDRFFDDVEQTVLRQFRTGQRAASIAPEISERFGASRKRAAFIARDQVSKLNGDLTRMRQIELGIPGYIWRTSLDERVRGSEDGSLFGPRTGARGHAKLEGTRQSWDKPPIVDERSGRRAHPGGDFN